MKKTKEKLLRFVNNEIQENIIGYRTNHNKDFTSIEEALIHIENKINESTFEEYDNIYVVIISDGKHNATKLKEKLTFSTEREKELFLINWEDKSVFKQMKPQSFEEIEEFKDYFMDEKKSQIN